MDPADEPTWWWCLEHRRVEQPPSLCRADVRLGPYPSEGAARAWRETVEARNERWEDEDEAWDRWPSEAEEADEGDEADEPGEEG